MKPQHNNFLTIDFKDEKLLYKWGLSKAKKGKKYALEVVKTKDKRIDFNFVEIK